MVEDLIIRLRDRYTVLIVTHNLAQAKRIADWVALFWVEENTGRLIEFASVDQFFNHPHHPFSVAYVNGVYESSLRCWLLVVSEIYCGSSIVNSVPSLTLE